MGELVSLDAYRKMKEEEKKQQEEREAALREEILDHELEDLRKTLEIIMSQFSKKDSSGWQDFYTQDDYGIDYYYWPKPSISNPYDDDWSDYEDEER